MKVELRGTIRASLGVGSIEVEVPTDGVALSEVLESLAGSHPRAARYLRGDASGHAVLRPVHNGDVVRAGEDPVVRPGDTLLLMHGVAGG